MAWYSWLALALMAWCLGSLVVGLAVVRVFAFGLADGLEALESPAERIRDGEQNPASAPVVVA